MNDGVSIQARGQAGTLIARLHCHNPAARLTRWHERVLLLLLAGLAPEDRKAVVHEVRSARAALNAKRWGGVGDVGTGID